MVHILSIDPGIINFSYCIINSNTLKIIKWGLFNIKSDKCKNETLILKLNEYALTENLKDIYIVIEKPPSFNKSMSYMCEQLRTYYLIRKINFNDDIKSIYFIDSKLKLKYYIYQDGEEPIDYEEIHKKSSSKHIYNKKLGIEHTKRLLIRHHEEEKYINLINGTGKRDDYCDSYLAGLYYLKNIKL